jgi:hypothetical protein
VKTGGTRVYVVAVTHSPPTNETDAVELPKATKRNLGLDDKPAWIVTTEANTFLWPGHDIRTLPRSDGAWFYGRVLETLMERIAASYLANAAKKRTTIISRDET